MFEKILKNKVMIPSIVCAAILFSMCSTPGSGPEGEYEPLDYETFIDGKEDTGYVSNKAAELEAKLTTKVYIDMTGKTAEEIQELAGSLATASRWTVQDHTIPQIKYGRNALKAEDLDLNLERGESEVLETQVLDSGLWMSYSIAIESLVKFTDLEEKGLTPEDLVGNRIEFVLPASPETVWEKGGVACASDPDGHELDPEELTAEKYFYYFDPSKEGCPLVMDTDLVSATYEIISSLDTPNVYPEYDMLTQDKKITMVALFGQITHGELKDSDWGWIAYNQFKRNFERAGFSRSQEFENNFGEQLTKTYPGNLEVVVDFYTPESVKDQRPRAEVDELFKDIIKNHEIVYYNGHSFYGSLNVLDDPEAYPDETYQVIFMDSCWSYAYYTKQVFEAKAKEETDPDGMKYADVVNNTEPGITGSHETAYLLYKNMFEGASKFMQGTAPVRFSWKNLIVYMNDSAERRARWYDPEKFHAEIYGASGVSRNCFNPTGQSYCTDGGESSLTHTYEDASGETPIPDNDETGITRTITVPDSFDIRNVSVNIDVTHSYIGDLVVSLSHGGKDAVLHNRDGGGSDDLRTTFQPGEFAGMDASGDWTLTVSDRAGYDEGKLLSWGLVITEPSSSADVITGENSDGKPIPDNRQEGIASTITIEEDRQISEVVVHLDITHTYVGDLVVILEHGGIEAPLMVREGGSEQNVDRDFYPTQWAGRSSAGEWKLTVADEIEQDTGTLDAWKLTIIPAPE